ncbi:MAG: hypothetical protein KTQ49_04995 [Candidatus Omnitrophica bacterium]|nr:hypothetical protein [Candidatus Omnitrophota bacterium]
MGIFFPACFGFAAEDEGGGVTRQIDQIRTRLSTLEEKQRQTLSQKDSILQQIDRVRIWARRSGGGK